MPSIVAIIAVSFHGCSSKASNPFPPAANGEEIKRILANPNLLHDPVVMKELVSLSKLPDFESQVCWVIMERAIDQFDKETFKAQEASLNIACHEMTKMMVDLAETEAK